LRRSFGTETFDPDFADTISVFTDSASLSTSALRLEQGSQVVFEKIMRLLVTRLTNDVLPILLIDVIGSELAQGPLPTTRVAPVAPDMFDVTDDPIEGFRDSLRRQASALQLRRLNANQWSLRFQC